ncbi:hypothetical protein PDIP_52760 [Penicillium digitatum Pd1]|uniref:Uncharacterized protein n=2 Tax=Penicillium digitatum TaxID=36651 RepID=K9FRV3_PEND1|nr:hypothetical protein PDIP_52760 [Penicillium digitatum Pd1]EKV12375.1 hypothetical protein PDIP_52760 [Penicillium digitatum Pd1]
MVPGDTTMPGAAPGETIVPGVLPGEASTIPADVSATSVWTGLKGPGSASISTYPYGPSVTVGSQSHTGTLTRVTPTFTSVVAFCDAACQASKTSTGLAAHTSPVSGGSAGKPSPSPSIIPFNAAGRATLSGAAVVFGAICAVAMQI